MAGRKNANIAILRCNSDNLRENLPNDNHQYKLHHASPTSDGWMNLSSDTLLSITRDFN